MFPGRRTGMPLLAPVGVVLETFREVRAPFVSPVGAEVTGLLVVSPCLFSVAGEVGELTEFDVGSASDPEPRVQVETTSGHVSVSTMHLAKGLEFRAVVVMACDDEIIPSQERIETVADEADLENVYNTERHLLYVACTRARDRLLVTGVAPASEFLDDLRR